MSKEQPFLWVVTATEIASDAWAVVSVHATEADAQKAADSQESHTVTYDVSRAMNHT